MKDSVIKILLVDDDSDDLQVIAEALKEEHPNLHVTQSGNGSDALRHLSESNDYPHLIILDINMPVLDGRKTVAALKEHPKFGSIPVVMLTTSSSQVDKHYFQQQQVEMLTKPWDNQQVKEVVQRLIQIVMTNPALGDGNVS